MSVISQMGLRAKLMLLVVPPLLALLVTDLWLLNESHNRINGLKTVQTLVTLTQLNSELAHELQKERGMSAGYLGSNGKSFSQAIVKQRRLLMLAWLIGERLLIRLICRSIHW